MAHSSRALTINDLPTEVITLRLRLENEAKDLAEKKSRQKSAKKETKKCISRAFTKAEAEPEPNTTKEATERNKAKMNEIFEQIKNRINAKQTGVLTEMDSMTERNKAKLIDIFEQIRKGLGVQEKGVLEDMHTMTEQQQQDTITFWNGVKGFFVDLFDWLKITWDSVLEKMREGWRVVNEAVKGLLETFKQFFSMIF